MVFAKTSRARASDECALPASRNISPRSSPGQVETAMVTKRTSEKRWIRCRIQLDMMAHEPLAHDCSAHTHADETYSCWVIVFDVFSEIQMQRTDLGDFSPGNCLSSPF